MVVKLHLYYIEFHGLTDRQLDYLNRHGTFKNLHSDGKVYRLYGNPPELYTALLLISRKFSVEILSQ